MRMFKPELTSAGGPILVHPDKKLRRHSQPGAWPPFHADQLQPWCGDRWEAVELECEEDGPWPRPLHTALSIP